MKGWTLIYNDGTTITKTSSKTSTWNNAQNIDVQFLIIYFDTYRRVYSGQNDYNLDLPNHTRKTGKLISNSEFDKTRIEMIKDRFNSNV